MKRWTQALFAGVALLSLGAFALYLARPLPDRAFVPDTYHADGAVCTTLETRVNGELRQRGDRNAPLVGAAERG